MPKFETFGDFVREKFKTQTNAAKILKTGQNTISQWVTGRNRPEPEMQKVLFDKYGYDGPWESRKSNPIESPLLAEIIEVRAALKAHIGYWERGEEKVLRRLEDAHQRISQLEKQVSELLRNSK